MTTRAHLRYVNMLIPDVETIISGSIIGKWFHCNYKNHLQAGGKPLKNPEPHKVEKGWRIQLIIKTLKNP